VEHVAGTSIPAFPAPLASHTGLELPPPPPAPPPLPGRHRWMLTDGEDDEEQLSKKRKQRPDSIETKRRWQNGLFMRQIHVFRL
jgi:hypothetical protein